MRVFGICIAIAFCLKPSESFIEIDSKWMQTDNYDSLTRVDCVDKPRLVKVANFSSINQSKPFVIKSPEFDTHPNYSMYAKCKSRFYVPSNTSVFLYFRKFDVAIEGDNCGDSLKVTLGQSTGYVFIGSTWEGKLLQLEASPLNSWLSFSFSVNGNKKVGKGFEIFVFGTYDISGEEIITTTATASSTTTSTYPESSFGTSTTAFTTAMTTTTDAEITTKQPLFASGILLVATGLNSPSTTMTEVKNLTDSNWNCKPYPSHPYVSYGGTAQMIGGKVLICGGYHSLGTNKDCVYLGESTPIIKMNEQRSYAASIPLNSTHILVSGGTGSLTSQTTEIISESSSTYGPPMPMPLQYHCFIRINETTAMMIGGNNGSMLSARVWSLDTSTFQWTELASLNTARNLHACGTFTAQGKVYVVVAGGNSFFSPISTEILDTSQSGQSWVQAPDLPLGINRIQMVTRPQGDGVIIMGGLTGQGPQGDFYELVCNDGTSCSNWSKLPITLSVPRYFFVALSVPDELC